MKQLSMEEKAKRYDEAIERAKEKYAMFDGTKQGDVLEDVFPELKESEDEKIRKELIAFVDANTLSNDERHDRWLSWLEKQGDQNLAWSEEDEKFFKTALWHISYSISNGKSSDFQCDMTEWLKSLKKRIQPKQELSKEGTRLLDNCISLIKDKELLLIDLCARLPYEVHCCILNLNKTIKEDNDIIYGIVGDNIVTLKSDKNECYMYYQIKPYLRPMSSMTEEECVEFKWLNVKCDAMPTFEYVPVENYRIFDWLNRHHFDYRGLIDKNLAIDCTNLNIY